MKDEARRNQETKKVCGQERGYRSVSSTTILSPTPVVLVSCAEKQHPERRNMITVAWAGTVNSEPPMLSISVRKERYSHELISASGEFVVNLVDDAMCPAVDYCGVRSGRDEDKTEKTRLTYMKLPGMAVAPAVAGAPVQIGCQVKQKIELGSHDLFLAEIVTVQIREDLMDEKGAIHLESANLVGYSHGLYQRMGEIIGFFGYSIAREEVRKKRMNALRGRRVERETKGRKDSERPKRGKR